MYILNLLLLIISMQICKNCLIPNIRPDQIFTKGVCNACIFFEKKKNIDWKSRQKELFEIIEKLKLNTNSYNCIVPSSGGKDSLYQALRARELGLNPLIVTATTCHSSDIGKKNIENLKNIGFDTIEYSSNPVVRKKLNRLCLEEIGDISWPEHVCIFTLPIKIACKFKIPLIIYGENSQMEYGGPTDSLQNSNLDKKWMEEFGGLIGLRVSDLTQHYGFKNSEVEFLKYPEKEELKQNNIQSIFLGYYENWDELRNFEVAKKNNFISYVSKVENSYFEFAKIDNYQHGIHDYFKYLKFGFGRATDQLSLLIRKKIISREEGVNLVKKCEGFFPNSYLGKPLDEILENIEMTKEKFIQICDKFTNKKIFKCDQSGHLVKDDSGNLIRAYDY
jgi:N-acetyl sugar amidotransferase